MGANASEAVRAYVLTLAPRRRLFGGACSLELNNWASDCKAQRCRSGIGESALPSQERTWAHPTALGKRKMIENKH